MLLVVYARIDPTWTPAELYMQPAIISNLHHEEILRGMYAAIQIDLPMLSILTL